MNIFIFKDKNNTSAGYVQITEDELQAYKKNSEGKVFLRLALMSAYIFYIVTYYE